MHTTYAEKAPDVGTTYRLWREFRTLDTVGVLVDPAEVDLTFEDPQGYRYTVNTTRESQGLYYGDVRLQASGQWRYRWVSEDPRFVYEGSFLVRRSEIEQPNDEDGFPVRFPDVPFFYADALSVKFQLYAMTNDGLRIGRVDMSLYSFLAEAKQNDHTALGAGLQPELDTSELDTGILRVKWTEEQVALLPHAFWLEVSEFQGLDLTDAASEATWNDLPDITWDELPEFTWDAFPDRIGKLDAIWDHTILVGHFRKNTDGF